MQQSRRGGGTRHGYPNAARADPDVLGPGLQRHGGGAKGLADPFGREPAFRVPSVYYAASDETGLSNLVLEDLGANAEAGDQIAGCSSLQGAAVVRELAKLHRAYWKSPDLDRLDWLLDPRSMAHAYAAGARVLRDWLGDRIGADALPIIDGFAHLVDRWLDAPPGHRTLVHGDPRVDNILFERLPGGGTRACLIDWQTVRSGDPQYDVAYFLSGRVAAAFIQRTDHNARLLSTLVARNVAAIRDWDGLAAIEASSKR